MVNSRRRKWTSILFFSLLALMLAVAAGCSSDDPAEGDDTSNGSEETPAEESGDEQAVDKASFEAELTILTPWGGGERANFEKIFADFNKEYPNIKVEYLDQTIAEFEAMVAGGEAPDIIAGTNLSWRENGLIEDLTLYIESDPDVNLDLLYEPAVNNYTFDGKVWNLPWIVDPNFPILYNRDILDQQGYPEFPEITSLEEMGDFMSKFWIVEGGEQKMTTNFREELMTWSYLNGATAETFYNPDTRKVSFNDPLIVETLEWMVQFMRENIDDERLAALHATMPEGLQPLEAGVQAFDLRTTGHIQSTLENNPEHNFGIASMPNDSLWLGGWGFGMVSSSEHKEAAWELLKWMTTTDAGARAVQEHIGWISGKVDNPYLQEQAGAGDPIAQIIVEMLPNIKNNPYNLPVDNGEEWAAKWEEVMAGTLEPKAFLDHMTEYTQILLDEQAQ